MAKIPPKAKHQPDPGPPRPAPRDILAIARQAGARPVLPFRPEPVTVGVAQLNQGGNWSTAIYREWAPGEAVRCVLCPRSACRVTARDTCMVLVSGKLDFDEARFFAFPGVDRRLPLLAAPADGRGEREGEGEGDAPKGGAP